jgi:hypothetical protein
VSRDPATLGTNYLRVTPPNGSSKRVYVKTRRAGDWQTDTSKGRPRSPQQDPSDFWLFVDLASSPADFFIASTWWVENSLYEDYQEYLAEHGGRRAVNPHSTHQRLTTDRVEPWRGCWDLLGLA